MQKTLLVIFIRGCVLDVFDRVRGVSLLIKECVEGVTLDVGLQLGLVEVSFCSGQLLVLRNVVHFDGCAHLLLAVYCILLLPLLIFQLLCSILQILKLGLVFHMHL